MKKYLSLPPGCGDNRRRGYTYTPVYLLCTDVFFGFLILLEKWKELKCLCEPFQR